jgi:hypothetical protein
LRKSGFSENADFNADAKRADRTSRTNRVFNVSVETTPRFNLVLTIISISRPDDGGESTVESARSGENRDASSEREATGNAKKFLKITIMRSRVGANRSFRR